MCPFPCLQVRVKRQERFYEARMARAKGAQVAAEKAELERDISLVRNFVSAFVLALQLLLLSHLLPPPGCRRHR